MDKEEKGRQSKNRYPTQEEVKSYYDDFLNYLRRDEAGNPRHEFIKETLKFFVRPGMKVLDLGCGIGITTSYLRSLGADAIGIDISPKLCEYAREKFGGKFLCKDILKLDLNQQFDLILMADIIEHIPLPQHDKLFNILKKHARSGTLILIYLPNPLFIDYVRKHKPESLQLVDESVYIDKLIHRAYKNGFELIYLSLYGIECPEQYVHIVFRKNLGLNIRSRMWSRIK